MSIRRNFNSSRGNPPSGPNAIVDHKRKRTALHLAVLQDDTEKIKSLIKQGASFLQKDKGGFTPLHLAAKHGKVNAVEALLNCGAGKTIEFQTGKRGYTALHLASQRGQLYSTRLLLKYGANPNAHDKKGYTPAHYAAQKEFLQTLKLLYQYGADFNKNVADKKETPLHYAATSSRPDVLKLLLKYGADPDHQGETCYPPLILAIQYRCKENVLLLLKAGANPNITGSYNEMTALQYACRWGDENIIQEMINSGAKINKGDKFDQAPLHDAAWQRSGYRSAQILLKNGADPNLQDCVGGTALHYACRSGTLTVLHLLLESGADPNIQNIGKRTPLHDAAMYGRTEFVTKIAQSKLTNLNIRDENGYTALHYATSSHEIDTVKALLKAGADPKIPDKSGKTAYDLAYQEKFYDIANLLKSHPGKSFNPKRHGPG